jgi:hypothetical protein
MATATSEEIMAAIVAGNDPVRGESSANFDPQSMRHGSQYSMPSPYQRNSEPQGRQNVPRGMDAQQLLIYDPYGYKAFSPSALPPSNLPSPAMAQDPYGAPLGLGLPGVSMAPPHLGGPELAGFAGWTPEQLVHYHTMQAQIAASMAGPQGMASLQQALMMGYPYYANQQEQPVPTSTFYDNGPNHYRGAGGGGGGGGGNERGGGRGRGRGRGGNRGGGPDSVPLHAIRRTPVLQEFHNTNGALHWELNRVFGMVAEFCKDQEGSRFIQRKLDQGCREEEVLQLLQEMVDSDLEDIIGDVFGNYVMQKLIEIASPRVRDVICDHFRGRVVALTLQTYGCRVIQRCIEVFPKEQREMIFRELEGNVARCVQDQNGNHVIQKCVEVDPQRSNFIVESFRGMVRELATHAYGCRVIQCVLQYHPQTEASILAEMQPYAEALATDQFGNYVMQHVILHCHSAPASDIIAMLTTHFYPFALHKFASNVMEKLYKRAGVEMRDMILDQLMQRCDDQSQIQEAQMYFSSPEEASQTPPISFLYCLIKDQFGNYVIQAILDVSTEAQRQRIIHHVHPYHALLCRFTYGKHIVARLQRLAGVAVPAGSDVPPPRGGARGRGGHNERGRGGRGHNRGGADSGYSRGGRGGPPAPLQPVGMSPNASSGPSGGSYQHPQYTASQQSMDYLSPSKEQPW